MVININFKPKVPANDAEGMATPQPALTIDAALARASAFSKKTGTDQITAFLIEIVAANFNEIELEKVIGEIANATGLGKRALRNGLKQLKHQVLGPTLDPGLALAKIVLEKHYQGIHLRLCADGTYWHYVGTHWEELTSRHGDTAVELPYAMR